MTLELPSNIIPLQLVADIALYVKRKSNSTLREIDEYAGYSEPYIRSGMSTSKLLGIIDADRNVDEYISNLGTTPNAELKISVIRKYIQEFEPFVTYIQYMLNDDSPIESARKVYRLFDFKGKDPKFLMNLFTSWGISTGVLQMNGNDVELLDNINTRLRRLEIVDLHLDDDMAIRLYIIERLSDDVFPYMTPAEISELTEAFKKHEGDPRGSIECAGRAFEDFLRRIALDSGIDVSRKSGIREVINAIHNITTPTGTINIVHNKQNCIGNAIGDIRNMAGHSLEARTMERWDLIPKSSLMYVELVLSTIRSIYFYVKESRYTF